MHGRLIGIFFFLSLERERGKVCAIAFGDSSRASADDDFPALAWIECLRCGGAEDRFSSAKECALAASETSRNYVIHIFIRSSRFEMLALSWIFAWK